MVNEKREKQTIPEQVIRRELDYIPGGPAFEGVRALSHRAVTELYGEGIYSFMSLRGKGLSKNTQYILYILYIW